jgi:hypothetical protein
MEDRTVTCRLVSKEPGIQRTGIAVIATEYVNKLLQHSAMEAAAT